MASVVGVLEEEEVALSTAGKTEIGVPKSVAKATAANNSDKRIIQPDGSVATVREFCFPWGVVIVVVRRRRERRRDGRK